MTRAAGLVLTLVLGVASAVVAQDVRQATAMGSGAARAGERELWSAWAPSGEFRARVVQRDGPEDESEILLVLDRAGEHWETTLLELGRFCGGTSEGSRSGSFVGATLVDFAGGPEPELFVDTHVSVSGGEVAVSQYGTLACSFEGVTPSCHEYVGGARALAPRSFGARGHVVIGSLDFEIEFLP